MFTLIFEDGGNGCLLYWACAIKWTPAHVQENNTKKCIVCLLSKEYFAVALIAGDFRIPQSPGNCIISSKSLERSRAPSHLGPAQTDQFTLLLTDEP